jgi:catechol 2,3-dioxygenase-like lactoylglutathione lyase family enzyme
MTDYRVEVVTLPVADVDRAMTFYTRLLGFNVDVDYHPSGQYRVVQLTPKGSSCSIQFGVGLTDAEPGSTRTTYLVVDDIESAHRELADRGVLVVPIQHKSPNDNWRGELEGGIDPERRAYASLATFSDPDGNSWVLQEVPVHRLQPEVAVASENA